MIVNRYAVCVGGPLDGMVDDRQGDCFTVLTPGNWVHGAPRQIKPRRARGGLSVAHLRKLRAYKPWNAIHRTFVYRRQLLRYAPDAAPVPFFVCDDATIEERAIALHRYGPYRKARLS